MVELIQLIVCKGECLILPSFHLGVLCVLQIQASLSSFWPLLLLLYFSVLDYYVGCIWLVNGFAKCYFGYFSTCFCGSSFSGAKKTFWLAINQTFFWYLWCKRNAWIFRDLFSSFDSFLDLILFHTLYWCKHKHPCRDYDLSFFISNGRSLL